MILCPEFDQDMVIQYMKGCLLANLLDVGKMPAPQDVTLQGPMVQGRQVTQLMGMGKTPHPVRSRTPHLSSLQRTKGDQEER